MHILHLEDDRHAAFGTDGPLGAADAVNVDKTGLDAGGHTGGRLGLNLGGAGLDGGEPTGSQDDGERAESGGH